MIDRIEHIGIAVKCIEEAAEFYQGILGLELAEVIEIPERGVRAGMIEGAEIPIELIEPIGEDSPVFTFLEKRGEGIHHLAFRVPELEKAIEILQRNEVELVNPESLEGAHGRKVVFLSPKSCHGVLIELCEAG